jgi:hypothetical protein
MVTEPRIWLEWSQNSGGGAPCRTRTCDRPLRRQTLSKFKWQRQFGLLLRLWRPASYFWSGRVEALTRVYDLTLMRRGKRLAAEAIGGWWNRPVGVQTAPRHTFQGRR